MSVSPVVLGLDVGGTFVDAVALVDGAVVAAAKAPSTPVDPVAGLFDAIDAVAAAAGEDAGRLLARTAEIVHGTTAGLNALLTHRGSTVGLLATRGHEDALLIGRVHQKVAGLGPDELIRVAELSKPAPLVPRHRIHGIDERIDATGSVLVELDEAGVARAARALAADGCDAIAIAFLWSFRNPAHEERAAAIVRDVLPGVPVSRSSDLAPVIGEYERTAAAVVNAYLGRAQAAYLGRLGERLAAGGFRGELRMLVSSGGSAPAAAVAERPVDTLRSGPVGGAVAVARLGRQLGVRNLLGTDMGGTSFDVGLVLDGRPELADLSLAGRLHLAVPTVDIRSIGAGGGSVAWVDADGGLHVGPNSVGADPGPACYGRGGTAPTVTDADLVLGRLNPTAVLGGRIRLDCRAAELALEPVARALGVDVRTAAGGIVRVADAAMADLVRGMTVERGHDPRRLVVVAFGGAAGLHAAAYGFDVGAREVIVPAHASMFSALGLALADPARLYRRSGPFGVPLDPGTVADVFGSMEQAARSDLAAAARRSGTLRLRREIDFRYRRQTHQVPVALEAGAVTAASLERAVGRFERAYERLHGPGTGYRAAGIEATSFRLVATRRRAGPNGVPPALRVAAPPAPPPAARRAPRASGRRVVTVGGHTRPTDIIDGEALRPGDRIDGPAVIDRPTTGALVHPGQSATLDAFGHLHLRREAGA